MDGRINHASFGPVPTTLHDLCHEAPTLTRGTSPQHQQQSPKHSGRSYLPAGKMFCRDSRSNPNTSSSAWVSPRSRARIISRAWAA